MVGAAYVFVFQNTWSENQKLIASSGAANDEFGYTLAAHNGMLVVGSVFDDAKNSNAGIGLLG